MARVARPVHLAVELTERTAPSLATAIVAGIAAGAPADGDWLPSSRALAAELGCARSLVTAAYDELVAAGFLVAVPGAGTRVAEGARHAASLGFRSAAGVARPATVEPAARPHGTRAVDLLPGRPDASLLDRPEWRRAWRRAATAPVDAREPWSEAGGGLPLAGALAAHLRGQRGIADAVPIVVPGVNAAVRLLVAATGTEEVVLESPGYNQVHDELVRCGVRVRFAPVDEDGLVVAALPERSTLVYMTPAHQYPLGHRMSVDRRAALIEWARRTGSLVLEDDYDGEFRYGVAALPPLRALPGAEDAVVYLGTASKILAPSLRAAWMVVPERLQAGVLAARAAQHLVVPAMVDRAIAEFITSGELVRHLARAARLYRDRRVELVTALREAGLVPLGVDAGLHVCLPLEGVDDVALAAALAKAGYLVRPLSAYPGEPRRSGLVVNFAAASFAQLRGFAGAVADAVPLAPLAD